MDHVDSIEKSGRLAGLKKDLLNRTLVGEFVGHPSHQHLVSYPTVELHFYSLTDHSTMQDAVDPLKAIALVRKYGLIGVRHESLGIYETAEKLKAKLVTHYIEMAQGRMECEEEGVVLYFVQRSPTPGQDFTLSLCKSKTIEYNIYRLLRELLRELITAKSGAKKVLRPHAGISCANPR